MLSVIGMLELSLPRTPVQTPFYMYQKHTGIYWVKSPLKSKNVVTDKQNRIYKPNLTTVSAAKSYRVRLKLLH